MQPRQETVFVASFTRALDCQSVVDLRKMPISMRAFWPAVTSIGLALPVALSGQEPAKPWSVEEIHGPARKVAFTVDEGTWISLDVSPDGRTIVFDLLGDLYTIPIAGGKATRLTSGTRWDAGPMRPFRPARSREHLEHDECGKCPHDRTVCDLESRMHS